MKEGDFVYAVSELGLLRGPINNFLDEEKEILDCDPDPELYNLYHDDEDPISDEDLWEVDSNDYAFIEIYAFNFNDPDHFVNDYEYVTVPKENVFTNIDDAIELFKELESKRNK